VWRVVQPDSLDGIRSAIKAAQKEEHAVAICGARHAMGGQQFLGDGLLIDMRRMAKVISLDAEKRSTPRQSLRSESARTRTFSTSRKTRSQTSKIC